MREANITDNYVLKNYWGDNCTVECRYYRTKEQAINFAKDNGYENYVVVKNWENFNSIHHKRLVNKVIRQFKNLNISRLAEKEGDTPMGFMLEFLRDNYHLPKHLAWYDAKAILAHYGLN